MNKKIVGIVAAAIVLILAIVIAVFALKGKDTNKSIAVVEQSVGTSFSNSGNKMHTSLETDA